jgi:hypothetical protein
VIILFILRNCYIYLLILCLNLILFIFQVVKVSLLSKNLPFERKIVLHDDFIIETTKSMNSPETLHINAHIFLLTDLLLICQEITQENREEKDLKLIYPPFNTNHLAINDVSDDQEGW